MIKKRAIIEKLLNVPLWVKTIGVVVIPLLLVTFAIVLYVRNAILPQLLTQDVMGTALGNHGLLTQRFLTAAIIAFIVGMILAYGLSRLLIYPLHQLIDVIHKVETGNLDARVPIWAKDEIGQVQRAFNHMAIHLERVNNQLHELNSQLLSVNYIAQEVSLSQDFDSIIRMALKETVSLLHADAATIHQFTCDSEYAKLLAVHGEISPELNEVIRFLNIDNSPMQFVLNANKAIPLNDVQSIELLSCEIKALLSRFGIKHAACAPIQLTGKTVGSINLARKTDSKFNTNDMMVLEAIGSVIGVGLANVQLLDSLKQKESELRRALRRSVELQEDERNRLARELHDETSQALTSILIRLRLLQDERDLETIQDRINGMRYLTAQTIEELRRISMDLRPAILDSLGIVPALRWLIQRTEEQTGIRIELIAPEKIERFLPDIELTLYRITQEGITNAIRHAEASKIEVVLEKGAHAVWLMIQDNGKGFDPLILNRGLGLVGIRERVELVNGKFNIETSNNSGTRLWVEISV